LKIRLLAACGTLKVCPACGTTLDDASAHMPSCTKLEGWNAASRHNAIRDMVHHFCGSHGIPSSREPFVGANNNGTRARADLRITLSAGDVYIDFTVANSMCKSHSKKQSFSELERCVQETKKAHYQGTNVEDDVVIFFMEVMGRLGDDAIEIVKTIEREAGVRGELFDAIGDALWRANASIVKSVATLGGGKC